MGCIVARSQVMDESTHNHSDGLRPRRRCCCLRDASRAFQRARAKLHERFLRMHENLNQGTSKEVDYGFHELQPPETVKKLARNHARFLVSLHHLSTNSATIGKENVNEKEKDSNIPQLLEKSWPMYFVDNIRIRKICDVSIRFGHLMHNQ